MTKEVNDLTIGYEVPLSTQWLTPHRDLTSDKILPKCDSLDQSLRWYHEEHRKPDFFEPSIFPARARLLYGDTENFGDNAHNNEKVDETADQNKVRSK